MKDEIQKRAMKSKQVERFRVVARECNAALLSQSNLVEEGVITVMAVTLLVLMDGETHTHINRSVMLLCGGNLAFCFAVL